MARYTNEMRERAVRMVAEVRPEHPHETAALRHVAGLLGMNVETLRLWVHRAQVDAGVRPGTTSEEAEETGRAPNPASTEAPICLYQHSIGPPPARPGGRSRRPPRILRVGDRRHRLHPV